MYSGEQGTHHILFKCANGSFVKIDKFSHKGGGSVKVENLLGKSSKKLGLQLGQTQGKLGYSVIRQCSAKCLGN